VSVPEHRHAVGAKRQASRDGIETGSDRLVRQSIEAEPPDACLSKLLRRDRGPFEALDAIDCLLNDATKALHAEGRARNSPFPERRDHVHRERPRVDLDRNLCIPEMAKLARMTLAGRADNCIELHLHGGES